ncbi:MAG: cytochrome d ubiquinol oxidase subunit II [Candidatus Methylacidiphilaceae bacterium]
MEALWYVFLVALFGGYVLLGGADVGVGILFPWASRSESERRALRRVVGPVWSGNEVWLIAGGGVLFFAFPKAYASACSGFYLALMILLWVLVFRGLSLEVRFSIDHTLWWAFWDAVFFLSSTAIAVLLGALLGNLIQSVPLDGSGQFFLPLWSYFLPGTGRGMLDGYSLLFSALSVTALTVHGAFLTTAKTTGDLRRRARAIAAQGLKGLAILGACCTFLGPIVQPELLRAYTRTPLALGLPLSALLCFSAMVYSLRKQRDQGAFLASSLFLLAALGATAFGLFPNLLISSSGPGYSLTARNAAASPASLQAGLGWFSVGFFLILCYTTIAHRAFAGRVASEDQSH